MTNKTEIMLKMARELGIPVKKLVVHSEEGERFVAQLHNGLFDKIGAISGKLASILEELSGMCYALHAGQDIQPSVNRLVEKMMESDPQWFQNAAFLLKELYNRQRGP